MNKKTTFKKLAEPCQIGSLSLVNRLIMPSMGNNYGSDDGYVTERLIEYYMARAQDGPALIITEMVSMDEPMGRRGSHQLRIDDDRFIEGLSRLTNQIHSCGRKIAIQLCHAGIQAGTNRIGLLPVAPSPIENYKGIKAREVSVQEIENIINQFIKGAVRAKASNFDGIEIHAAHNYLLAYFLSPFWNKRHDEFGGNTKNRAKILTEVMSRIRVALGSDYPIWCRMNGKEYGLEGGLTLEESKEIARMAEKAGCDAIHVSAGAYGSYFGYNRACMGNPSGNLAELAAGIKNAVSVPVIAVGRIDLQLGDKLIREKKADLIAIGRGQIADPQLIKKSFLGRFDEIRPCISCNTCVDDLTTMDATLHCSVNPCVGKEADSRMVPALRKKRVLVIGGGPGGMQAAIVAALKGHEVIIYEKQPQLGGKLNLAAVPPHKHEISSLINYLVKQTNKLEVKVELEKAADITSIKQLSPDVVVLAAGASPLIPKITGVDSSNVVFAEDVLAGKTVGKRVVIVGGGLVGCETAEFLAEKGKAITIIEMLDEIALGVGPSIKVGLIDRLKAKGVVMVVNTQCQQINDMGVVIKNKQGEDSAIAADSVVLAVGAKPDVVLLESIKKLVPEIHLVGDAVEPRRILFAISDGYQVGLSI